MRLIKKIFNKFFLLNFFFAIVIFSKLVIANNQNEANTSILKRLPTSIFATVNGEPISIYDLIQRSILFSISAKIPLNEDFEIKVLPDLISGYVDQIIQMQQIKKEQVFIPNDKINQIISQIEKENGFKKDQFKKYLKEQKTDISILEKQIEVSIGWKQLIANKFRKQILIQDTEIETIHKKLKSNVGKEEFLIEQIFLSFENKEENEILKQINKFYQQIQNGGDFGSIANQFSDTLGGKVGKIGWTAETDLDIKIINEVKKLEIEKMSKPIKGENGYFIIKVLNKRIIGDEIINEVSLFRFQLTELNDEINLLLNEIKNCSELEDFSKKYGSVDSGSLGMIKYNELSKDLQLILKKMNKNEISEPLPFGTDTFQIMLCDVKSIKPVIPSKFKISDILINRKLDTIARQYMSELRSNSVIDIRI